MQQPLVKSIGERIKALRTEQRMTLAELGRKANLSTSYLSQIERDKTTPSLSTLTLIAKSLNVGLRYFFEAEADEVHVVRAESQDELALDSPITRQYMTPEAGSNKLEVCRVMLQPHTSPEQLVPYPGEGFIFVLAGKLNIVVGNEQFVLDAGDSIHYDALQPHCWTNEGDEPCAVIWSRAISRLER
jgi:transcriptional regulator with XRE-family HTH domain